MIGIGVLALFLANMELVPFNKAITLNQRSSAFGASSKNNFELVTSFDKRSRRI